MADPTWRIPEDTPREDTGAHGTRRIEDPPTPAAGAQGTMRVEESQPAAGTHGTMRVEDSQPAPTGAPRPLGFLNPGTVLCGEYEVVETINPHERMLPGVYRCRISTGESVVLKVAAIDFPPDRELWARLARLDHPHVLHILFAFEQDGLFYEVQEFCDAGTLHDAIPRPGSATPAALGDQELRTLVRQVGSGLEYLHRQGIVHRDIKPKNIYFKHGAQGGPLAVLGDFDISSTLDSTRTSRTTARAGGTWTYTAPESFPRFMDETGHIGAQITRAGDYYSFGICLLEVLLGTTSLHTCGLSDLYDFYLQGNRVAIPSHIPARLAMLLRGLLILNRHQRWGPAEIVRWLEDTNTPEDLERIEADARYSVKRAGRPYRIKSLTAFDLHGLADILLQEPDIAKDDLMSGDILLNWIAEQDTNVAREVRRQREWWRNQPDVALWCTVLCCDPSHPLTCADGTAVNTADAWLAHTEELIRQNKIVAGRAFSNEALTGLEVWLGQRADGSADLAERIKAIRETPVGLRQYELEFLLQPERPLTIADGLEAPTPAVFVRLAYGKPDGWREGIPPCYQAAMNAWTSGLLTIWLRQRGAAETAQQVQKVGNDLGVEYPHAAFETILRLLDPSLPLVKLELDRSALSGMRVIPAGIIRRYNIPYRTQGPGVPFGNFTSRTNTQEITLENTHVTRRAGTVTVVVDIDAEPYDCNPHRAELLLDSGYATMSGPATPFWYRMAMPAYFTPLYLLGGAVLGGLFFWLPRYVAAIVGTPAVGGKSHNISLMEYLVLAIIIAEVFLARWIWQRVVLHALEPPSPLDARVGRLQWQQSGWESISHIGDSCGPYGCRALVGFAIGAVWLCGLLTQYIVWGIDMFLSGGGMMSLQGPFLWGGWGAVLGAALGFWHVAPIHNLHRWRIPLLATLAAVAILLFVIGMAGK